MSVFDIAQEVRELGALLAKLREEHEALSSKAPNLFSKSVIDYVLSTKETHINTQVLLDLVSKDSLQSYCKVFQGDTDSYWKDLEEKGKKILVLWISPGSFVRSAGKRGEEMDSNAVNWEFLLFDGIDFKSNDTGYRIEYLEV